MKTNEIAGLVDHLGQPGQGGRLQALKRTDRALGGGTLTNAQRQFLDEVTVTSVSRPPAPYAHPADAPGSAANREQPLTPSQVAWLNRLPTDPAQVSWSDAAEVFRLLQSAKGPQHQPDLPLLRSVADPLREFHDGNQAQTDLERAQHPLTPTPPTALGALADAVAAENDQLQPNEAISRASSMLGEIGQKRVAARDQAIRSAQDRIAALHAAHQARTAVTR